MPQSTDRNPNSAILNQVEIKETHMNGAKGPIHMESTHAVSNPLMQPPQFCEYFYNTRIARVVLPTRTQEPYIRLLDACALMKYIALGGKMLCRQVLEREHPELFCGEELVKTLLRDINKRGSREDLVFFPGFVALSYARISSANPDPNREQLQLLAPLLEWQMSERALLLERSRGEFPQYGEITQDDAPTTHNFGIFIDFMCMHQPDEAGHLTPEELESVSIARYNLPLLLCHAFSMQWAIAETPGNIPDRAWSRRGWCGLEDRLSSLLKRPEFLLDISKWNARGERYGAAPASAFGTAAGAAKSVKELASQGDCWSYKCSQTLSTLQAPGGAPLLHPDDFSAQLQTQFFDTPADLAVCVELYSIAARTILGEKEHINFHEREFSDSEWHQLVRALPLCSKLSTLHIRRAGVSIEMACNLFNSLGPNSLPKVTVLNLSNNPIGKVAALARSRADGSTDTALHALVRAFERGALPSLTDLHLSDCHISGQAFSELIDCFGRGLAKNLSLLDLNSNPLGNDLFKTFGTLPAGALPELSHFFAFGCGVEEVGVLHLMEALKKGVMPKITQMEERNAPGFLELVVSRRVCSSWERRASLNSLARKNSLGLLSGRRKSLTEGNGDDPLRPPGFNRVWRGSAEEDSSGRSSGPGTNRIRRMSVGSVVIAADALSSVEMGESLLSDGCIEELQKVLRVRAGLPEPVEVVESSSCFPGFMRLGRRRISIARP